MHRGLLFGACYYLPDVVWPPRAAPSASKSTGGRQRPPMVLQLKTAHARVNPGYSIIGTLIAPKYCRYEFFLLILHLSYSLSSDSFMYG